MSYVRLSENSDLYIYLGTDSQGNYLMCCSEMRFTQEAVDHIEAHKLEGCVFPDDLIENIKADDVFNFGELKDNKVALEVAIISGVHHG